MKARGFTLVELLIVIAIIGVLAGVLIPQLLGARASAVNRAAQTHSANVYKALTAVMAEDASKNTNDVVASYPSDCLPAVVPSLARPYGWTKGPINTVSCTIAAGATDFVVTVITNANGNNKTYINGAPQ